MTSAKWSVVMTDFTGKWMAFHEAAPSIFGREGLDVFSLTLRKEKHLPAEVADNLSADEAARIVAGLAAVGADATAVPTAQVQDVRHRAAEAWPSRTTAGFGFTEIDGMILTGAPLNARENLEYIRESGNFSTAWRYERGANHRHADMSRPVRECVCQELQMAVRLEVALREAYPTKHFVISHMPGYAISFWQATDERPDGSVPCCEPTNDTGWCQSCQRNQPYLPLESPDAEFPQAEWGRCTVCGHDVLVRAWEIFREVVPASTTDKLVEL